MHLPILLYFHFLFQMSFFFSQQLMHSTHHSHVINHATFIPVTFKFINKNVLFLLFDILRNDFLMIDFRFRFIAFTTQFHDLKLLIYNRP